MQFDSFAFFLLGDGKRTNFGVGFFEANQKNGSNDYDEVGTQSILSHRIDFETGNKMFLSFLFF